MPLDFLGIGAQKSGTTWLYENLRRHPGIFLREGKEIHFWDVRRDRGLEWYRSLFVNKPEGSKAGEITPAYAILPMEVIREIWTEFPNIRLIYLIRNPMDRAWSSALMALGRAEMTIDEASDQWFLDHFRSQGSLRRGDYETCLRNWRSVYPDDSILVVLFEEIQQAPLAVLRRVAAHIGIDPSFFATVPMSALKEPVFAGLKHAIRPSPAAALAEIYAPKIERLARYLGRDLSHWRR